MSISVIGELLRYRARLSPDVEAVVSPTKRLTYREYNELVNKLAHYMLQLQVQKGDRIALICKNSHHFPIIYMAAAKIGAVTVPINWRLKTDGIRYILEDCTPKILFYDGEFDEVTPLLGTLPFIQQEIRLDMEEDALEELVGEYPDEEPQVEVIGEDPALIIYTSGTTGRPKGVVCTHTNMFAGSIANTTTLDWRYRDRFLVVTPLFHISGMVIPICALVRGLTLVVSDQFHPVKIWDLLHTEKINIMFSVPSMLNYMYESLKHQDVDVPSLRMIICGGSKVPANLIRGMYDFGYQVIQVYGATEFAGAATFWLPEYGLETCESAGKAVYLTEMKIVDPTTGESLPPGEIGEVVCRGPLMFAGYWNMEEATQEVIRNGWYHTRDVGWMDETGLLYVVDRLRDMIIYNGENVFPAQVESVINQLEEVAESAVVGVAHPVWGELVRAYVVRKEGRTVTEEEIITHARRYLPDHNLHEVVFVEELPKNSMGKVMKHVLREHANQQKQALPL
ncbi:acyl--CoA ligase [Polycladomyces abyssicola]|uniref:Acyl--CoA ligase n=1 Tax=Polycladomyces abyssicola TaxID=1125966 RepID=A0A8D5UF08_9BACL|nr:long-chain-fatty-acid--CoA ligase [Polycladomyces abyssicola]BCU81508.1 acyl--CoA ligase [Polycladomyces abyssicola]